MHNESHPPELPADEAGNASIPGLSAAHERESSDQSSNGPAMLLRLENIGRTYVMGEVKVEVLRHVRLEIARGEFLAVVGPSGSGKSTMMNIIGGLDKPTTGHVLYEGREISKATPRELTRYRRDEVGFVFQFYNLVPNLTARENVMVTTEISEDPMDPDEALELVGLAKRSHHFPAQMSGGEQQRVAIARAIAKKPKLLLCDEPTGALDFETGKLVLRLLVDLNKKLGETVVVITHNAALAQVARRIVHLRSGEITEITENEKPLSPEEVVW